jgi:hypothetical protein
MRSCGEVARPLRSASRREALGRQVPFRTSTAYASGLAMAGSIEQGARSETLLPMVTWVVDERTGT